MCFIFFGKVLGAYEMSTLENSVTLILCSFFCGSLKINALVRYLGLGEKFVFSKDAKLIDGTHSSFNNDGISSSFQPDMYIRDETKKQLLLIESKVSIGTGTQSSQTCDNKDSYIGIVNHYIKIGWKAHLVFIIPKEYEKSHSDLVNLKKNNEKVVSSITWNKFIESIDNESEFNFFKNQLIGLGIENVDAKEMGGENGFYKQPVDLSYVRSTVIWQQKIGYAYIFSLIKDCCKDIKESVGKSDKKIWQIWERGVKDTNFYFDECQFIRINLHHRIRPQDTKLYSFGDYIDNPVLEYCCDYRKHITSGYFIYVVCGFDLIKNKFAIYYRFDNTNLEPETIYNHDIALPLYVDSYELLKQNGSIHDKLKKWVEDEHKKISQKFDEILE